MPGSTYAKFDARPYVEKYANVNAALHKTVAVLHKLTISLKNYGISRDAVVIHFAIHSV